MVIRSLIRSPITSLISGVLGQSSGGIAARFTGDPYTEGVNDSSVTVSVTGATIGATWDITISSSGGGTPVTDTGTVADEDFDITGLGLTGLNPGSLSLSYEEDSVVRSTDIALLMPPFDDASFDSDAIFFDSDVYTFDGVTA